MSKGLIQYVSNIHVRQTLVNDEYLFPNIKHFFSWQLWVIFIQISAHFCIRIQPQPLFLSLLSFSWSCFLSVLRPKFLAAASELFVGLSNCASASTEDLSLSTIEWDFKVPVYIFRCISFRSLFSKLFESSVAFLMTQQSSRASAAPGAQRSPETHWLFIYRDAGYSQTSRRCGNLEILENAWTLVFFEVSEKCFSIGWST